MFKIPIVPKRRSILQTTISIACLVSLAVLITYSFMKYPLKKEVRHPLNISCDGRDYMISPDMQAYMENEGSGKIFLPTDLQ